MNKFQKRSLMVAGACGVGAVGVAASIVRTKMTHGPAAAVPTDILNWLWGLLGGGAAFSLPALFNVLKVWLPKIPLFGGNSTIIKPASELVDATQIAVYIYQIEKASSPQEKATLTSAARILMGTITDDLFPLDSMNTTTTTPAPVVPPPQVKQ